jgi:hypothetical protein
MTAVLGKLINIFVFGIIPLLVVGFFVYMAVTPYVGLTYSSGPSRPVDYWPLIIVVGIGVGLLFLAPRD